ncbi:unnamed protein product [Sympodiomycopsis kandeliae]
MPPKKRKASHSPPEGVKLEDKKTVKKAVKKEESGAEPGADRFDPLKPIDPNSNWPAPGEQMQAAKEFIQRLLPDAKTNALEISQDRPLIIIPDKDADGLCSGLILQRTLEHLGISRDCIKVHHLTKGTHVASASETERLKAYNATACVVLDQGSRPGPPLLGHGDQTPVLVIDHHFLKPGESGPEDALMINASHSPPVATSSLLTWCICRPFWGDQTQKAQDEIDWLAVMGTAGDLSVNVEWEPPMPDFTLEMKKWTKKRMGTCIALLNAPRRTPDFNVSIAYTSLLTSKTPIELLDPALNPNVSELYELRQKVSEETEKCTHTAPKFSKDGRLACLFIDSAYQIHPGIATRWSGALRGAKNLQVIMCANKGYSPYGTHTHFSCRRANAALKRGENPNIIQILHDYASRDSGFLKEVVRVEAELEKAGKGEIKEEQQEPPLPQVKLEDDQEDDADVKALSFARGHREASGGILPHALFERFVQLMEIGVPPNKSAANVDGKSPKKDASQKTKLTTFFSPQKEKVKQEV